MWAAVESGTLFVLIQLYIWWIRPYFPHFWILLLAFVVVTHALRHETPARLGFQRSGFGASLKRYGGWVVAAGAALAGIAVWFGTIREIPAYGAAVSVSLYCLWGTFQQYLLNGYFVNRFSRFTRHASPLAAVAFAAVHTPNWFLMLATAMGGYCAARAYLRFRNLYFLGLAHGMLGFLIYLSVPDSIIRHLYVGPKWFGK